MDDYTMFKEILNYDPETGKIVWKIRPMPKIHVGDEAGTFSKRDGYRIIEYNNRLYKAHRIAWLLTYKEWPKQQIDHINGIRDDNRICNLRDVSHRGNSQNRDIHRNGKIPGARYDKRHGKWQAIIKIGGTVYCLGQHTTEQDALKCYNDALIQLDTDPSWRPSRITYSKCKGYVYRKDTHKYWVRIKINNIAHTVGHYDTPEEAHEAYLKAKAEKYGIPVKEAE